MNGRLLQLLRFEFAFGREAHFHFWHNPAAYAFLLARLNNPPRFPDGVHLVTPESGRVRYRPDEHYVLGIAVRPDASVKANVWRRMLAEPPSTRAGKARRAPFGRDLELVEASDVLTGQPWPRNGTPRWLTYDDLDACADMLDGRTELTIRFDTPLQIPRTPVAKKTHFMDDEVFDGAVLFDRIRQTIVGAFPDLDPGEPPAVEVLRHPLARADVRYPKKTLRGTIGRVDLACPDGLPLAWARALPLAGTLGVGVGPNMGQGRFTVVDHPLHPCWPPRPARTLLQRAAEPDRVEQAREGMAHAGRFPGVDGITRDAFAGDLQWHEETLRERLAAGAVEPSPLRGVVLERDNGALRGLAVPTMEDRYLQRAVVAELAPAIDALLADDSYAYRHGFSRRHAEFALRKARDEGYTHVLDADLRGFFDTVDWDLLETRLRALLRDDPITDVLMRWLKVPVHFADEQIERTGGLPQGAPISPMLANLYLDAFDRTMADRGWRVVRYADDFVVLCRSAEEVERARAAAEESLAALRLELAEDKTQPASFNQGFRFLGYLFCGSVVLDSPNRSRHTTRVDDGAWQSAHEIIPADARGWLADWMNTFARASGDTPGPAVDGGMPGEPRWQKPLRRPRGVERPVYVTDGRLRVAADRKGITLWRGEQAIERVGWSRISELVLMGVHRVSSGVYQQAMHHRVPIAHYRRDGTPAGLVLPDRVRSPSPTAIAQWKWSESGPAPLAVARSLIEAKIHNLRLLARHQRGYTQGLRDTLAEMARAARRADSITRLRGLEGRAAWAWFDHWPEWVEAEGFGFPGRSGRGARDPLNALLNLLYTQLFRLSWLAALTAGLDPYLGVLHDGKGRYAALAADLQEPFRVLADRYALELVHRRMLTVQDFALHEKQQPPCRLRPDALRRVLSGWEDRLRREVEFGGRTRTYRQHILDQAERLAAVVEGERSDIQAFRLKW